jgi:hypothetical protein
MTLSAELTFEQLTEIIVHEKNRDIGANVVEEQVGDGEEALDSENRSLVLNTVLNTIQNAFEYKCLDETVRLLNAHPIR